MRTLLYVCRVIVGSLFIVSGLIKANDAVGFSYKLTEYFEPEVLNWTLLEPFALGIAMLICLGEVILGIAVVLGGRMKITSWFLLGMILFFTGLTFYSAYFDKVTDCGCFGDAIKLTPWQSFTKDLVLLLLILPLFIWRNSIAFNSKSEDLPLMGASLVLVGAFSFGMLGWGFPFWFTLIVFGAALALKQFLSAERAEWATGAITALLSVLFIHHTYAHLPVKDFRPYAVGKSIPEGMAIPEGQHGDVYETTLTYRNSQSGEVKDFTQQNYPWEDPAWEWVSTNSTLVEKGYTPPVHDLQFLDVDGVDNTEAILSETSPVILMIIKNCGEADTDALPSVKRLSDQAMAQGWYVYGVTASGYDAVEELRHAHQLAFDFMQCDETTLKTIVRSNPGVVLLKQGVIAGKWHANDVPDLEEADEALNR